MVAKINLTEQTVRELAAAIKTANTCGEPVNSIEVSSPYSNTVFSINLGESESIGYRISRMIKPVTEFDDNFQDDCHDENLQDL